MRKEIERIQNQVDGGFFFFRCSYKRHLIPWKSCSPSPKRMYIYTEYIHSTQYIHSRHREIFNRNLFQSTQLTCILW